VRVPIRQVHIQGEAGRGVPHTRQPVHTPGSGLLQAVGGIVRRRRRPLEHAVAGRRDCGVGGHGGVVRTGVGEDIEAVGAVHPFPIARGCRVLLDEDRCGWRKRRRGSLVRWRAFPGGVHSRHYIVVSGPDGNVRIRIGCAAHAGLVERFGAGGSCAVDVIAGRAGRSRPRERDLRASRSRRETGRAGEGRERDNAHRIGREGQRRVVGDAGNGRLRQIDRHVLGLGCILRDPVLVLGACPIDAVARERKLGRDAASGILINHQQRQIASLLTASVGREVCVVAGRRHDRVAVTCKVRKQLERVVDGVGLVLRRARQIRRLRQDPIVAILTPSVEIRGVVFVRIGPVVQVPPNQAVKLGLKQRPDRVGEIEAVYQAGGLLARIKRDRVVFSAGKLNSGDKPCAVIVVQHRPDRRRDICPGWRDLQKQGVAFIAWVLRVVVVDHEVGDQALAGKG